VACCCWWLQWSAPPARGLWGGAEDGKGGGMSTTTQMDIHTHTNTRHQHMNYKALKLIKSHYKAVKHKMRWDIHFWIQSCFIKTDLTVRQCGTHMGNKFIHSFIHLFSINPCPSHIVAEYSALQSNILEVSGSNLSLQTNYLDWGHYFPTDYSQVALPFDLLKPPINKSCGIRNAGTEYICSGATKARRGQTLRNCKKKNEQCPHVHNDFVLWALNIYQKKIKKK
jgi:hypothetical protein